MMPAAVTYNLLNKTRFLLAKRTLCLAQIPNEKYSKRQHRQNTRKKIVFTTIVSAITSWTVYNFVAKKRRIVHAFDDEESVQKSVGAFVPNLPSYTLDEVRLHSTKNDKIWVTYRQGVYDITDFVAQHPGGDKILLAAGASVEPFWLLYAVHNNPNILLMLEKMRIGNISLEESKEATKDMEDPYNNDPVRHPALRVLSKKPFNAEAPTNILIDNFITPADLFYVRNHLPVPEVDPNTYEIEIEFEGTTKILTLDLEKLKSFPKHSVVATIMCAGNRRGDMSKVKIVKGLDWGPGAVGTAKWSGARLRDVLLAAGVIDTDDTIYRHVQFEGLDTDPTNTPYGASIPFWRAIEKRCDVILAYEMNGEPLTRDHGYPVRVVVPGVVGARNVKWLGKIIVAYNESDSHWQQNDYKGFSPSTDWDTVDFSKSPAIQELPVISAICTPKDGDTVSVDDGFITITGYAWSGGGQRIVRVDVTTDNGKTWHVANFHKQCKKTPPPQHWTWTLWTAKVPVNPNASEVEVCAKAVDSNYNTQPESFENIWNLRGVLSNAYHRITLKLQEK